MSCPKQCLMPDLSSLDHPVMGNYTLNVVFGHARITDRVAKMHVVSFIRMIDKALREYEEARVCLERYVQRKESLLAVVRTTDHLETCINAIVRAFKHLDRIRRDKASPQVPRQFWGALRSQEAKIRDIRGCVEHMDEDISTVAEGQAIALTVTAQGDAAEVGGCRLSFSSLARTIKQLHAWASKLAQYSEEATIARRISTMKS